MYRDEEAGRLDEIESRLVAAERANTANTSGRRWLSVGVIALTAGFGVFQWRVGSHLVAMEASVALCDEGEVAEEIAERHRLTREQDTALCNATCASLQRLDDIPSAASIAATCSWDRGGVRFCSCACSVVRGDLGGLAINYVTATESR